MPPDEMLERARPFAARLARAAAKRVRADPADLLQEFLLDIWRAADRYDPARGGVMKFTFLRCRKVLGRRNWRRWAKAPKTLDDGTVLGAVAGRGPDPADLAELRELARLAVAAVGRLPNRERLAVAARFGLDGRPERPAAQIRAELGLGATAVTDATNAGLRAVAAELGADPDRACIDRRSATLRRLAAARAG